MTHKKRINIELGKQLHAKAKVIAVLKEISLNDYLVGAIRSAVGDDKSVLEGKGKD